MTDVCPYCIFGIYFGCCSPYKNHARKIFSSNGTWDANPTLPNNALYTAVKNGILAKVEDLLKKTSPKLLTAMLYQTDSNGQNAGHIAASNGFYDILVALFDKSLTAPTEADFELLWTSFDKAPPLLQHAHHEVLAKFATMGFTFKHFTDKSAISRLVLDKKVSTFLGNAERPALLASLSENRVLTSPKRSPEWYEMQDNKSETVLMIAALLGHRKPSTEGELNTEPMVATIIRKVDAHIKFVNKAYFTYVKDVLNTALKAEEILSRSNVKSSSMEDLLTKLRERNTQNTIALELRKKDLRTKRQLRNDVVEVDKELDSIAAVEETNQKGLFDLPKTIETKKKKLQDIVALPKVPTNWTKISDPKETDGNALNNMMIDCEATLNDTNVDEKKRCAAELKKNIVVLERNVRGLKKTFSDFVQTRAKTLPYNGPFVDWLQEDVMRELSLVLSQFPTTRLNAFVQMKTKDTHSTAADCIVYYEVFRSAEEQLKATCKKTYTAVSSTFDWGHFMTDAGQNQTSGTAFIENKTRVVKRVHDALRDFFRGVPQSVQLNQIFGTLKRSFGIDDTQKVRLMMALDDQNTQAWSVFKHLYEPAMRNAFELWARRVQLMQHCVPEDSMSVNTYFPTCYRLTDGVLKFLHDFACASQKQFVTEYQIPEIQHQKEQDRIRIITESQEDSTPLSQSSLFSNKSLSRTSMFSSKSMLSSYTQKKMNTKSPMMILNKQSKSKGNNTKFL